jgi:hypothetical protein
VDPASFELTTSAFGGLAVVNSQFKNFCVV